MKTIKKVLLAALIALMTAFGLQAQEKAPEKSAERAVVTLSNPGKPCLLKASLLNGGFIIKGYDGKEVIVEAKQRGHVVGSVEQAISGALEELDELEELEDLEIPVPPVAPAPASKSGKRDENKYPGMKKLTNNGMGWSVEEEDNVVRIEASLFKASADFVVMVPRNTSLKLNCVNGGKIIVENVNGELEIENVNGSIALNNVGGTVVAKTVNGKIAVTFNKIDAAKAMSFATLNGDIDITLPAATKATFKMKVGMKGDIYSDFDLAVKTSTRKEERDNRSSGGRYKLSFDNAVNGTINGGGQEISITTFTGDILLRKGK